MSNTTLKRRVNKAHDDLCAALMREVTMHIGQLMQEVTRLATVEEARDWLLYRPNALDPLIARIPAGLSERDDELFRRLDECGCSYDLEKILDPLPEALAQVIRNAGDDVAKPFWQEYQQFWANKSKPIS